MKKKRIIGNVIRCSTAFAISAAMLVGSGFVSASDQQSGAVLTASAQDVQNPVRGSGSFRSGGHTFTYSYKTDINGDEIFSLDSVTVGSRVLSIPQSVFVDGRSHEVNTLGMGFGKNINAEIVYMPDTIKYIDEGVFRSARIGTLYVSRNVVRINNEFCSSRNIDSIRYSGNKLEYLGADCFTDFLSEDYHSIGVNSHGAVLFGDWLVTYIGDEKELKISDLGEARKISKIAPRCFKVTSKKDKYRLEKIDLTGVEYIGNSAFYAACNLDEFTGCSDIRDLELNTLSGTQWYNDRKNMSMVVLGDTLLKYHTDGDTISLTRSMFNNVKYIAKGAIVNCKNATVLKLSPSIQYFTRESFSGSTDPDKISRIYIGNRSAAYNDNDQFMPKVIADHYSIFENSEYAKTFAADKVKGVLKLMGLTYYGRHQNAPALSAERQYEIAYKIHEYITANYYYDFDGSSYLEAFLCGNCGIVCQYYAMLYSFMLESAGIDAEVVVSDGIDKETGKIKKENVHAWNLVKIGDKWYHADVCSDAVLYGFGSDMTLYWFLVSDDFMRREWLLHGSWKLETEIYYVGEVYNDISRLPTCDTCLGDVNGDTVRDSADSDLFRRYLLGYKDAAKQIVLKNCDTNLNGSIEFSDIFAINNFINHRTSDPLAGYMNHTAS